MRLLAGIVFALVSFAGTLNAQDTRPSIASLWEGNMSPGVITYRADLSKALAALGWVADRDVVWLEPMLGEGRVDLLPALAAAIVTGKPSSIITFSAVSTQAAKGATTTIPIVMDSVGDPVGYGLVANLSRPGGNVTGTTGLVNEMAQKLLQQLHEAAPRVGEVAIFGFANPGYAPYQRALESVAPSLGLKLRFVQFTDPSELDTALAAVRDAKVGGILVPPESRIAALRPRIAAFAVEHGIAVAAHGLLSAMGPGVLIAGGSSRSERIRVLASYLDKVLRGAKPADLPVAQPTAFEMAVNLQTAAALGITLPLGLIGRADMVIDR